MPLDCDKFKSINDTYGHAVGDKVIIAIADTLRKSCRDDDVVLLRAGMSLRYLYRGC